MMIQNQLNSQSKQQTHTSDTMGDPFDKFLGNDFESKLQENCFQVMQLISLVAQNPQNNSHFATKAKQLVTEIEASLEERGYTSQENQVEEVQTLDVVDLLFLRGAEGLKNYFQNMTQESDYDDDGE